MKATTTIIFLNTKSIHKFEANSEKKLDRIHVKSIEYNNNLYNIDISSEY